MAETGESAADFELTSVLRRLKQNGEEAQLRLEGQKFKTGLHILPTVTVPIEYSAYWPDNGYSEGDYLRDKEALKHALEAAGRTLGDIGVSRLRSHSELFVRQYLRGPAAAEEIRDLVRAVRDWLPFVSRQGFVPLANDVPPRDGMSLLPDAAPMPQMQDQSLAPPPMPEPAPEPPPLQSGPLELDRYERDLVAKGDKVGLGAAQRLYVPWRGLEGIEEVWDPRRMVLAQAGLAGDDVLRENLYSRHPILLVIQFLAPPRAPDHPVPPRRLNKMLALPAPDCEAGMREVVRLCIRHCLKTATDLFDGMQGDVDWSRFRPLLQKAAEVIVGSEKPDPFLRRFLDDLVEQICLSWSAADTVAAAAVTVAIALQFAGFYISGPAAIVLTVVDFGLQTAAVHIHEGQISAENRARSGLNSLEMIDQALLVAGDPVNSNLGWWLGIVSLLALPAIAKALAQRGVALYRGRALGAARAEAKALEAARAASRRLLPAEQVTVQRTTSGKPLKSEKVTSGSEAAGRPVDRVELPQVETAAQSQAPAPLREDDWSDILPADDQRRAEAFRSVPPPEDGLEELRAAAYEAALESPRQRSGLLDFQKRYMERFGDPNNMLPIRVVTGADGATYIDDLARQAGLANAQRVGLRQFTSRSLANAEIRLAGFDEPLQLVTFWQRAVSRSEAARNHMAVAARTTKAADDAFREATVLQSRMNVDPALVTDANHRALANLRKQQRQMHDSAKSSANKAYNLVRTKFWDEIHRTPRLSEAIERETGLVFKRKSGKPYGAPELRLGNGRREAITLEHAERKADNPLLALDPDNLQLLPSWANSTFNEIFRGVDPFSKGMTAAARAEEAFPSAAARLVDGRATSSSRGLTPSTQSVSQPGAKPGRATE